MPNARLRGLKGVVHAIRGAHIICMLEQVGETNLYSDEIDVLESPPTLQIGDLVRVIPVVPNKQIPAPEGKHFIGVMGRIVSWDTYQKDKLPCVQFISSEPSIHGMKWYLWRDELEKVDPNAGLPKGVVRCRACFDATTSSSEGVCCDCKIKQKESASKEWW